jgi:GNAT superfamily N-acetyltransferase
MFSIRPMNADDVPRGMELKDQAGWNQTPLDWHRLLDLQPAGCFVAQREYRTVGTACCTTFGSIGWISMVLVDVAYRGQGIGTQLMSHALTFLDRQKVETVRLDATPLGRPVYARLGFIAEYEVSRHERAAEPASNGFHITGLRDSHVAVANSNQMDSIAELDRWATGTLRRGLLDRLRREWPERLQIASTDGRTLGYGYVRLGSRAVQIGPVVAINRVSGTALLESAIAEHDGQLKYVDIPLANRAAMQWADAHGFRMQRQFTRMFRGRPVVDRPDLIWASFGPEKG